MSLAVKALGAIKSNYIGTLIRVAAQFFAQLIIMRELGPDLVGVFGYTLLLYGLMALIIDQGFGWSLIQGDFSGDELRVVLARLLLGSVLGMVLVFLLSYPIEQYLHSPLAGMVFRYSAPSYLLIAVYGISHAKLRAELRFREIQLATTGAYLIAYPLVGVGLALAGYGVWALLAAWYVQAILQFVIGYYFYRHSLALANPFRATRAGRLGLQVAGINVMNWAVDNSSGVFVGAMGPGALGNFNAASMLSRTPALQVAQTLQSVLFSTASAVGDDRARIRRLYLAALAAISLVVVPAYAYAINHAHFLVTLLFGSKWANATEVFAAMAVGMMALAMSTLSGAILTASGGQNAVLKSQLCCLALMLTGLYFSLDNLAHVGLVISAAYVVRLLLQALALGRRVGIGAGEFLTVLRGPVMIAVIFSFGWLPGGAPYELAREAMYCACKLVLVAAAVKLAPRYFLCPALVDVMRQFGAGRRVLRQLQL